MAIVSSVFSQLRASELSKIHWKNELIIHVLFGIPIISISTSFWNLSFEDVLKVLALYVGIWLVVFVPFYYVLPRLLLRKVKSSLKKLQNSETLAIFEVKEIISALLFYSDVASRAILFVIVPAYLLGSVAIYIGLIPEVSIELGTPIAIFNFVLGLGLAVAESLLNYAALAQFMRAMVKEVLVIYPDVLMEEISVKRIPLGSKLMFFCGGLVFIVETILLNFFISTLAILAPELLFMGLVYGLAIVVISFVFLVILIPKFSSNIAAPLEQIVTWSRMIMSGKTDQRLLLTTNDELADVVRYETQMMVQLNQGRTQVEHDRDVIKVETHKLEAVLAGISDGVVALDINFKILFINDSGKKLFGLHTDSWDGVFIDDIASVEDLKHSPVLISYYLDKIYRRTMNPEQCFTDMRYVVKDHSGRFKSVSIGVQYIASSLEKNSLFILTFHDLTEFLRLEDMKLDFVSMAAHELRTPLTAILGYLSIVSEETKQVLNEDQKLSLGTSIDAAKNLNHLIEDVIAVARLEKGDFALDKKMSDMVAIISSVIEGLSSMAVAKQVSVIFTHEGYDTLAIYADTDKITEVVRNLILNAITYNKVGGEVRILLESSGNELVVWIRDSGVGISKESQRFLFSKFYRVKKSLEQGGGYGTGLGLYMSQQIIEMHGGTISCDSQEGVGSTFSFRLPMTRS